GHEPVVDAVEVTLELHDLRPPCRHAGDAHGERRGLGARHRESDLLRPGYAGADQLRPAHLQLVAGAVVEAALRLLGDRRDRKSTRLNSSHGSISYAVFCLKKKNNTASNNPTT